MLGLGAIRQLSASCQHHVNLVCPLNLMSRVARRDSNHEDSSTISHCPRLDLHRSRQSDPHLPLAPRARRGRASRRRRTPLDFISSDSGHRVRRPDALWRQLSTMAFGSLDRISRRSECLPFGVRGCCPQPVVWNCGVLSLSTASIGIFSK